MRIVIRYFFKTIRIIMGPFMLMYEWLTNPKGISRSEQEQQNIDEQTSKFALYQFKTCPFCIKVRQTKKRLSLNIETRDAQRNEQHREELRSGGGQIKVPCLKTIDEQGNETWLYESNEIIRYLEDRFAA